MSRIDPIIKNLYGTESADDLATEVLGVLTEGSNVPVAGNFYIWPDYWTHFHKGVVALKEEKFILTGWINYV